MKKAGGWLVFAVGLGLLGVQSSMGRKAEHPTNSAREQTAEAAGTLDFGGEPAVTLVRPKEKGTKRAQFLEATVLPGFGMNLLELKAYLPGKGEVNVIDSPSLGDAKRILEQENDEFSNKNFQMGGAILLPYPNRIRGKLSADGKTIETTIGGHLISLPANWEGKKPGAERHAMHGLILDAKFQDVKAANEAGESKVSASYDAGNFGGHWLSKTDVAVEMILKDEALDILVTTKNVGNEALPMAIGFHPYFAIPSGDRTQAKLHVPADERALVTNYDDVFPTGQIVPVKGTPYDFTSASGADLGALFMDDCFTDLKRNAKGEATIELTDPAAHYGVRILTLSPHIKAVQVYAPPDKNFVAIEPQFNLADPFNTKIWGKTDTGMVYLQPGQSVTWHIRLEVFATGR
ncbi:MAG TPA: aldose 1-epimerase [Verrucomicrobiae bacterium]|nr:aldose 1-epimerase [Verrucomicrobiae bacterium]